MFIGCIRVNERSISPEDLSGIDPVKKAFHIDEDALSEMLDGYDIGGMFSNVIQVFSPGGYCVCFSGHFRKHSIDETREILDSWISKGMERINQKYYLSNITVSIECEDIMYAYLLPTRPFSGGLHDGPLWVKIDMEKGTMERIENEATN